MSDAWEGTCGFHDADEAAGFWPLGSVAFRTSSAELIQSAKALCTEAEHADPERAAVLLDVAAWYEDLALDLAEIRALPEYTESPFQAIGGFVYDDDIPF